MFRKKIIFLLILSFFMVSGCDSKNLSKEKIEKIQKEGKYTISINNKELKLDIASDYKSRVKGLSGRDALCEDCGMLFVFDQKNKYDFWMKDMKFPIDIIYIDGDKIVEIFRNVEVGKDGKTTTVSPKNDADKVLEVNANWSDKNNLKEGQILTF